VYQRGYRRMEQDVTLKPKEVRTVNIGTLVRKAAGSSYGLSDKDLGWAVGGRSRGWEGDPGGANRPRLAFAPGKFEVGSRTVEINASRLRAVAAGGDRAGPGDNAG